MTSPFLNEKIFIYNVGEIFKEVSSIIKSDYGDVFLNKDILHDFISWSIKKSFMEITGIIPKDFKDSIECTSMYLAHRIKIDNIVFSIIQDIGIFARSYDLNINLVLTNERLYIITF